MVKSKFKKKSDIKSLTPLFELPASGFGKGCSESEVLTILAMMDWGSFGFSRFVRVPNAVNWCRQKIKGVLEASFYLADIAIIYIRRSCNAVTKLTLSTEPQSFLPIHSNAFVPLTWRTWFFLLFTNFLLTLDGCPPNKQDWESSQVNPFFLNISLFNRRLCPVRHWLRDSVLTLLHLLPHYDYWFTG